MTDNPRGRSRLIDSEDWATLFLRGLALILIVLGLYQWAIIIGVVTPSAGMPFTDLSGTGQAAIMNLAVAFPVAATGLWMLTSWGVVIWIYAAAWQIAMHTLFAGTFGFRLVPLAIQIVLLVAYAGIIVMGRHSEHERVRLEREHRQVHPNDRPVGTGRFSVAARARIAATLGRRARDGVAEPAGESAPPGS